MPKIDINGLLAHYHEIDSLISIIVETLPENLDSYTEDFLNRHIDLMRLLAKHSEQYLQKLFDAE